MFKIVTRGNPTELEMSRDVFDMSVRLAIFINDNFERTDFFTVGNTGHSALTAFLGLLQETQNTMSSKDSVISLSIDFHQLEIFESIFMVARMFFDDMEEFDEEEHNRIYDMAEIILKGRSVFMENNVE